MLKNLRKDLVFILAIAAVFVSLSYAIGFVANRPGKTVEVPVAFLSKEHQPKAQSTSARVWRKPAFEKTAVLNSATLKAPAKMQADNSGNILVLDWKDLGVKQFSPDGKLLKAFVEDADSPDAFENPTGFTLDANGNMWVCDFKKERVGVFNADGTRKFFKPQNTIYRMAALGDVIMTMVVLEHNRLFETYDLSGRQLKSFGEFLEDQPDTALALEGDIVADAENRGIIYGGRYLGMIGAYDAAGNQRYLVQTIDNVPPPMVLNIEGRRRKVKPMARPVLSLSLVGNELYVLSGVRADAVAGAAGKVIDVYDKQDGHYLYSWELPVEGQEAIVASNYIYIRSDKEVTVWRYKSST